MSSNWYAESGTALILDEKETIEFCKKYLKEICGRNMVKVPDAYTAVEELGEQALIRSKYKHEQADSSSIEEVDEKHLDDDYTNDKNEIMQLMEEREKIISDRLSFAEYIYDKIPERTIWTYYHVVRQLDHIQNMDFYKDEKNKQTLAQVRHPLRKAIRRKQKYMHRFISNEDIERFKNLIIAEEHKNCKDYINYKKSYEYLFYFGFTKIRDKCKDTLKIIARMKKELEEINDLKEDRKES